MFFEGKARAAKELRRLAAWTAWHSGVLSQARKIPPLSDLMRGDDEPAPSRRQTPEQQLSIAMAWNAYLGGKVVYRDTD